METSAVVKLNNWPRDEALVKVKVNKYRERERANFILFYYFILFAVAVKTQSSLRLLYLLSSLLGALNWKLS